ncbi:MAG: biopolymer transporter ExbD [Bdellovibrionaceae bacterium]|nr:biopolymer transporter ExbD [Bdellovibrionales bacterium]MCB9085693.1 biopolymer transporter ExbD [Pseudobdellovibrionaceae bacterium]
MISTLSSLENNNSFVSSVDSCSSLNPKAGKRRNMQAAALMLTSLVDAFSILVIYLLVSMSNSGEVLYIDKGTELPTAVNTHLLERNTVVKLKDDKYFIEEKEVGANDLVARLVELRKEWAEKNQDPKAEAALTVQADKDTSYEHINRIVASGNHAGFGEINFAVLQN